jgi:DNA-binding XRE family transcriptional regulator
MSIVDMTQLVDGTEPIAPPIPPDVPVDPPGGIEVSGARRRRRRRRVAMAPTRRPPKVDKEVVEAVIYSNRIKHYLIKKGLTQEELSRRVKTSYRHINRLSLGRSHPSLLLAHRIAAVLEEPVSELFHVRVRTRKAA